MANVLLPKRDLCKPPVKPTINWGHPLANGLLFAFVPTSPVLYGNYELRTNTVPAEYIGVPSFVPTPYGLGVTTDATHLLTFGQNALWDPSELSLFCIARTTHTGDYGCLMAQDNDGGAGRLWIFRKTNGNVLQLIPFNSVTNSAITGGTTITDGAYHGFGATWDRVTLDLYVDGIKDAAPVSFAGPMRTATWNFNLGWDNIASALYPWIGTIVCAYAWGRGLTPNEMQWLHVEPFAMLTPQRVHRYSIEPGTAAPAGRRSFVIITS